MENELIVSSEKLSEIITNNMYQGISCQAFDAQAQTVLASKIDENDIEIRPDGLIYLPEIKYRIILNKTFGAGAWAIHPRGIELQDKIMCYKGALYIQGRFIAEAIGEQEYFKENPMMSYATAAEAAKSNCLMRCCKDIGIASELWNPQFIEHWKLTNSIAVWCENKEGKKKLLWRKITGKQFEYPWKERNI